MNLFDDEFNDIIDNETTSSIVLNEQREREFNEWKEFVLSLKYKNDYRWNAKANIVHNISDIIKDQNNITLEFDSNIKSNIILCPITFLTECPLIINNINMIHNSDKNIRLILYSPRKYNEQTEEMIDEPIDIDLVKIISSIEFEDINVIDILFRGTFNNFEDYHKFIDILKDKFNANIWMNYTTKIENPGIKFKKDKNFLGALLRHDELVDDIIYNDIVNISYATFINNGTLTN